MSSPVKSEKKKTLQAEAFTMKSRMKNAVVVGGPPSTGIYQEQLIKSSGFSQAYDYNTLPVQRDYNKRGNHISWKVDIKKLDYSHYLPLFFDGLCETEHHLEILAVQGIHELLDCGGSKIVPVVPQLIQPIRNAMNTKNPQNIRNTLKVLQHLVKCDDGVGPALVPFFQRVLPVLRQFKNQKKNLGDEVELGQQSLGDLIEETLCTLERYGGPQALRNIIYNIPTYQSCMSI